MTSDSAAWSRLEDLLRHDPGQRGIAALGIPDALAEASQALLGAERVVIACGFPVWSGPREDPQRRLVPESDGPPGALALGRALRALGIQAIHVTDARSAPLLRACGAPPRVCAWTPAEAPAAAAALLRELRPDAVVAIELPGRARCGSYFSMRGEALQTPALDELVRSAAVPTVAIGDGGNEAGLAGLGSRVAATVGSKIATVVAATHVLAAGVSNWGAYALIGALSLRAGRDLVPSRAEVRRDLEAMAAAGAVDGILKTRGLYVDGQPFAATASALEQARTLA